MIKVIDKIVNEIIIASSVMKTNNLSRIAQEIGHRPVLIFCAMYRAGETGKFTYNKKRDTIKIDADVEPKALAVTEGLSELIDIIEIYTAYLNSDEKDVTTDELRMTFGGISDTHIDMALLKSDRLATYEFADPSDKKSVYTFITLKENIDKKFGVKQFDKDNSKAKRHAEKTAKAKK